MDITTLSTKGQIVIPEKLRREYQTGKAFVVSKVGKIIVLKPVNGLTPTEEKELKELNKIWSDIDKGKATTHKEKEFFSEMKQW